MQKDIHPQYNQFKIKIGKESFETMSCYSKSGDYIMDRDFRKHPAWTKKGVSTLDSGSGVVKVYEKKYGNLSFLDKK